MSHISKPVDWEIFSIPPIQPIQYYPILKKKREFSQLIRQYDSQVLKHGFLHYCGIVPKNISSSLSNKYELLIVFFDEGPNTSFIGFRVKVSKETFMHESNSLILFLKKSKQAVFYLMSNNCIHVQCGTNAWELFYLLYDVYLRQYVLTIIGTKFFYHFVYSYCIQKEIQLLEMLFKGSKIIRVSEKSIYYKIHRKRKISVTDLIHMTLNMPKSKRYVISSFNSKESVLHSDFRDANFYNSVGNKIHVSKLVLKKFKKQFKDMKHDSAITDHHSEPSASKYKVYKANIETKHSPTSLSGTNKRKFEEIKSSDYNIEPDPTVSTFLKISRPMYHKELNEDEWEQYKNFKPYTVKSYSCILSPTTCSKIPDFLNKSSHIITHQNTSNFISHSNNYESHLPLTQNISCISSDIKISSPPIITSENFGQGNIEEENCSDLIFTTAAGSAINVSNTAMLTAHRLIQDVSDERNHQNFQEKVSCDENQRKRFKVSSSFKGNDLCKKSAIGHMPLDKTCVMPSDDVRSLKCSKITSKKLNAALSESIHENFRLDNLDNPEDVNFSTAAGKILTVSNTAMQAAHKLIEDVFKQEKVALNTDTHTAASSYGIHMNKLYKNASVFRDNGCSSKQSVAEEMDVDMDNTLVEKFFEDTLFDENELETISECKKDKDTDVDLKPNSDKNLPARKPRKSLGGRRSARFFSSTL